ncbi:MAG: Sec-independent protein translocase protein TatB [Gammaproteobacteria bacterium]|nr:Sec-independent protein translocase protein TatB [Gammaproteobacteria bacterium]
MELVLVAVVALLVIGPERLPAVARTVGFWIGKVRKFVSSVQDDFNREVIKSEELKRLVEEQAKIKDIHEIMEHTVDDTRKTVPTGAKLTTERTEIEQAKERKETPRLDSQDTGQKQNDSHQPNPATPESSVPESTTKADQTRKAE